MMKWIKEQAIVLFTACLVAVPGAVSAAVLDDGAVIWRSAPNQYIRYASQDNSRFGPNDHPVQLDAGNIAVALESLETELDPHESIFSAQQATRLGEALAKALSNASPDQDIVFALEKNVTKWVVFTDQVFTAGRAFYKDGKLNVIIGNYDMFRNKAFERVYDSSGQLGAPYTLNHGSRSTRSGDFNQTLASLAGAENKVINNKMRRDWLVIDVDQAVAAVEDLRLDREQGDAEAARQMQLEGARMREEQRELKQEMTRMREEMRENSEGAGGSRTIEGRLTTLKRLYDQELISKEEYEAKRREILSEF